MSAHLLNEGPIGHMAHPYENLSLSFRKLKEMFKMVVDGFPDIEVTEKLDGQNIIITFDHNRGKARIIRRMAEHSAMGGIDKEATKRFFTSDKVEKARRIAYNKAIQSGSSEEEANLAATESSKGAGIPHVAAAFYDAMVEFERAAVNIPEEFFVTEDGCQIFYNGEVIDPRSRNIVDYDTQDLVIHRSKHSKLCPDSNRLQPMDDEESKLFSSYIEKFLSMSQVENEKGVPKVKVNALVNFDNIIVDKEILSKAYQEIDTLVSSRGLSDASTIKDYLKTIIDEVIEAKIPNINRKVVEMISDAVFYFIANKSIPRLRTEIDPIISLVSDEQTRKIIKSALRDRGVLSEIVREAIKPIEYIVHNFAADYLKAVKSLYILNHDKVLQDLRSKVGHQVTSLQAQSNKKDLNTLRRQIHKMINHQGDPGDVLFDQEIVQIYDKIASTVEGLVFAYDGQEYKLTGQFAPINQIMGMGRFDRGKRDDLSELADLQELPSPATYESLNKLNEDSPSYGSNWPDEDNRKIAVYSGGFKPPHGGHYLASKYLVKETNADILYILVGASVRTSKDGTIKIGPKESAWIWNQYYDAEAGLDYEVRVIELREQDIPSPVKWAYSMMESGNWDDIDVFLGIGQCVGDSNNCPPEARKPEDKRWNSLTKKYPNAQQVVIPLQGGTEGDNPRGSIMRELLALRDDRFMQFLPDHLDDEQKLQLRNNLVGEEHLK